MGSLSGYCLWDISLVTKKSKPLTRWPEEKLERTLESQSRRLSPDQPEQDFSAPWEGSTVTSRAGVSPLAVLEPPPLCTAPPSWSTSPPRYSSWPVTPPRTSR